MTATILITEGNAPTTPGAGTDSLYVAPDGKWHIMDDTGADKTLAITTDTLQPETGSLTNAKLANMAQATIKGRAAAAGTGVPVDLTDAQVATILADSLAIPGSDTAWTAVTLEANYVTTGTLRPSAFSSYAVPGYRKAAGIVHLRGAAKCTGAGYLMFTLPAGYRPEYDTIVIAAASNDGTPGMDYLVIYSDGEVHSRASTNFTYHLDSVRFAPA